MDGRGGVQRRNGSKVVPGQLQLTGLRWILRKRKRIPPTSFCGDSTQRKQRVSEVDTTPCAYSEKPLAVLRMCRCEQLGIQEEEEEECEPRSERPLPNRAQQFLADRKQTNAHMLGYTRISAGSAVDAAERLL